MSVARCQILNKNYGMPIPALAMIKMRQHWKNNFDFDISF